MSAPPSLRDLYVDPSSAWTFEIPKTTISTRNAGATSAYQWSTRPSRNSVFELSPLDFSEHSGIDAGRILKTVVASAFLQYTSTAIANPWEVGKLLLQVQWVPRDAGESDTVEEFEEDALSDGSNEDAYFADPNSTPPTKRHASRPTDEQGYVIRRSIMEEGTRPEYVIPVGSAKGVWEMIKRVATFRNEGWLALWKGLLTSCITEVISSTIQPLIHNLLQSIFFPSLPPFHQPSILLPVASHLITGFILSPLDLIRTRLIVQSYNKRHRTYSGPLDALSKILRQEGGLTGIYFHSHLLLPTIIDNTLRPLISLAFPGMLASLVGANITKESNPIAWGFAELSGSCLGLLISLPFETIRKRLQVQVRGTAKPIKSCVELRPTPYNGIVDAFWHILTEERSDLPINPRRRRQNENANDQSPNGIKQTEYEDESWSTHTGIGQLYRGMGMRLGAGAVVFFLAILSGGQERDSGWAEI